MSVTLLTLRPMLFSCCFDNGQRRFIIEGIGTHFQINGAFTGKHTDFSNPRQRLQALELLPTAAVADKADAGQIGRSRTAGYIQRSRKQSSPYPDNDGIVATLSVQPANTPPTKETKYCRQE